MGGNNDSGRHDGDMDSLAPDAISSSGEPGDPAAEAGLPRTDGLASDAGEAMHERPIDERDVQAMRAFLTRGEARLSTIHRLVGVFLSGAGLLVLFAAIFKDSLTSVIGWTGDSPTRAADLGATTSIAAAVLGVLTTAALSFYYLLRDLTLFYYTANAPWSLAKTRYFPRLSLSGLVLPKDYIRGERGKAAAIPREDVHEAILASQLEMVGFVLPPNPQSGLRRYLERLFESHKVTGAERDHSEIVPERRQRWLKKVLADNKEQYEDARDVSVMFGISGSVVRSTIEEVARMELSLARHTVFVRLIVLRYIESLILFFATAVLLTINASLLSAIRERQNEYWSSGCALVVWAIVAPWMLRAPMRWLSSALSKDTNSHWDMRDSALTLFEKQALRIAYCSGSVAMLGALIGHWHWVALAASIVVVLFVIGFTWATRKAPSA